MRTHRYESLTPLAVGAAKTMQVTTRAHPAQREEGRLWDRAPKPEARYHLLNLIRSPWVYKAVMMIAELAASAPLNIVRRDDHLRQLDTHPMLDLVGEYGNPNSDQDSFEFWVQHFADLILAGNSYWYWDGSAGGAPTAVHLLNPQFVAIEPGSDQTIKSYFYTEWGLDKPIDPRRITQFRLASPFSRYFGLSPLQALVYEIEADRSMSAWNNDFFGGGVSLPAGILVVPFDTPDAEIERLEIELQAKHAGQRRTAIVRAEVGSTVFQQAGINQRDSDFIAGRKLSRQAIYEVLGVPLGMLSESSTEAHALVAERQFAGNIRIRHTQTSRKLTSDALPFWARWRSHAARFEDVTRQYIDWRREAFRWQILEKILTTNEMRTEFEYAPVPDGDTIGGKQPGGSDATQQSAPDAGAADSQPGVPSQGSSQPGGAN